MSTTDGQGSPVTGGRGGPGPLIALLVASITLVADLVMRLIDSGHLRPTLWVISVVGGASLLGMTLSQFPGLPQKLVRTTRRGWNRLVGTIVCAGRKLGVGLGRLPEAMRWSLRNEPLALLAVAVLTAITTAVAVRSWVPSPGPGDAVPCGQPLELRVLTTPDSQDAIQEAADRFAVDQAKNGGCRPVHVTVFARSSFPDIEYAFTHDWWNRSAQGAYAIVTPLLGPQPDVWIPASTAEVEYIADRHLPGVGLDNKGSLATSPLVFAIPEDYRERLQGMIKSPAPTWRDLVDAATSAALGVARPDPQLSEAGLLATADLYRDGHGEKNKKDEKNVRRSIEKAVTSSGTPLADVHDLLCSIRSQHNPEVAVIVPEQALVDYNRGKPLGDDCVLPIPRPHMPYVSFRPAEGRSLDYPFVRITWSGQADPARDALIDRLEQWLRDGLRSSGYRDTEGHRLPIGRPQIAGTDPEVVHGFAPGDIDRTLHDYRQARESLTAAFIIDVSGSMNQPIPDHGSRLDRARDLAAKAFALLGPADAAGLWEFSASKATDQSTRELAARRPVNRVQQDALLKALVKLSKTDERTPLYDAIDDAVEELNRGGANPTIVVFTDGDDSISEKDAARLAKRLTGVSSKPRIYILAIGPKECEKQDVKDLSDNRAINATCVPATDGDADPLISQMFAELRSVKTS